MVNSSKMPRRNFMQQSALWAAALAGAGSLAPRVAKAARDKELNIFCWEGYNTAPTTGPSTRPRRTAPARPPDGARRLSKIPRPALGAAADAHLARTPRKGS